MNEALRAINITSPVTLGEEKILLVEDSPTQAMLLKESLDERKLNVMVASNGAEAIKLMQTQLPTIIISDIEMPYMDGYEFCRYVKQDPRFKHIPVILLTNLTDSMDAVRGIECGADSFLTKPCEIDFLLSTMVNALYNRRHSTEPDIEKKMEFFFAGQKHSIQVDHMQVIDLLLSTFSAAIQKNAELEKAYRKLNIINEEMEHKNTLLEQLNREKNQLLGMAAHDLRNPLSIIQGFSQLIIERLKVSNDEESVKMLGRIKHSSSFMLQLINDLLDVSTIEAGEINLHISRFDLVSFLDEVIFLVSKLALAKQITLVKNCSLESLEISGDRNKIEQVFTNLLTNAIKFSNPSSEVNISLEANDKEIIFSIQDQGAGIPVEERDKLFKPFSKTSAKGTAGEPSTGLGLAIVNKIVLAHKGRVWVESEVGVRTTFFVALPRQ